MEVMSTPFLTPILPENRTTIASKRTLFLPFSNPAAAVQYRRFLLIGGVDLKNILHKLIGIKYLDYGIQANNELIFMNSIAISINKEYNIINIILCQNIIFI